MDNIIELRNVTFSYSQEKKDVLKNINLGVKSGEWLAIIGPNGSGKSTLVKTLNGILPIHSGEIRVGEDILNDNTVWSIREKIGLVFQNPENQFVGATVADDVAFGLENKAVARQEMLEKVEEALQRVNMLDYIDREPSSLSGGQKQRVAIAGILALEPEIIVLDESTSMLDPKARQDIMRRVKQLKEEIGMTVISITHDIDEAVEADRIVIMKEGQILEEGSSSQIFSKGQELLNLGLDLPFSEKLKLALKKRGLILPDEYLSDRELEAYLWTLKSET